MRFRFLYLNEAGEEVEVGGVEELRACVAMGRVDENTLLYDSVTREWAPARAHSAYRMLADELSSSLPGTPRPDPTGGQIRVDEDLEGGSGPLPELTPLLHPDLPDTQSLFLERQARLRRMEDHEAVPMQPRADFHIVVPDDDLADRSAEAPREPPLPEREGSEAEPEPPRREAVDVPVPRLRATAPPRPIKRSPVGWWRQRNALAVGGAALVLLALWGLLGRGGGIGTAASPTAPDGAASSGSPVPSSELPAAAVAAQGSAFEDMVMAMDSLRGVHDVTGAPSGWLDGHYLAVPSEYPHVAEYWRRYETFVSDLRSQDTALFRMGFLERLREDGLEGPVVQMRLARALDEFRASQPARAAVYAGMEALASRSLALHDLLLAHEGEVDYDPVQPGTVSRDPVMEAFPRDPELRERIWAMLDGIFEAMEVVQGGVPGSRDELGDAALREIRQSGEGHR